MQSMNYYGNQIKLLYIVKCQNGVYMQYNIISIITSVIVTHYIYIYIYYNTFFRTHQPIYAPNACRIHGSLNVNKVAGNFHITAGKSLSIPKGHIHISAFMTEKDYNFTHRINKFSFGGPSPGIVHPLEGDEKIADNSKFIHITIICKINIIIFKVKINIAI